MANASQITKTPLVAVGAGSGLRVVTISSDGSPIGSPIAVSVLAIPENRRIHCGHCSNVVYSFDFGPSREIGTGFFPS
jgi:hypothetical protein